MGARLSHLVETVPAKNQQVTSRAVIDTTSIHCIKYCSLPMHSGSTEGHSPRCHYLNYFVKYMVLRIEAYSVEQVSSYLYRCLYFSSAAQCTAQVQHNQEDSSVCGPDNITCTVG
jgi:hypothetical protein